MAENDPNHRENSYSIKAVDIVLLFPDGEMKEFFGVGWDRESDQVRAFVRPFVQVVICGSKE